MMPKSVANVTVRTDRLLSPADEKKPEASWLQVSGSPYVAIWCPEPDSNRHTFRRRILNPQK
jgi:hypothetical protein